MRCRADLIAVETIHKNESAIVVKDPVAMKYHRMRPDEYFVLQRLDGTRSLEQICDEYEERFAPQRVSAAELNRLLFRFHQSGLTISDVAMQGDRLADRRRKDRRQRMMQHISGVLFIRFPGVDPEPLLRRLYPLMRPLLGPLGMASAIALCLFSLLLFVTRWEQFSSEFPRMSHWLQLDSVLILAAVIGLTKVLHELGHAVTCKHFGGECHQIGPMLLVFTPALYCDTSDSWLLPSRWQRAAVGMAGIATEVFLAAVATIVWTATAPGLIHYLAMNVMLVCSVSTLMFNANPLLRYDGYYVLSDLCDVPNLAEKSRRLLAQRMSKLLLGVDREPPEPMARSARFWMMTYGISAAVYRWGLTLLILWFVSIVLRPYRLESLGRVICLLAAGGLLFTLLRGPIHFLRNPAQRRLVQMKRTFLSMFVLAGLVVLACIPLPSGVNASGQILPRQETPIYITTAGRLESVAALPGSTVKKGDTVATLINDDIQLQYVRAKGRFESQQRIVDSIRRSQFDTPEAANELPAAKSLLEDLQRQLETRKSRLQALVIRAPASGTLIAAPKRPAQRANEYRLVAWSGYPTDPENQNCYLQPGTELMSIAEDGRWDAELILSQSEVRRFRQGAEVKLVCESTPAKVIRGTVTDISRSQWTAEQNGQRRDDPSAVRRVAPPSTSYVVRVALEEPGLPMVAGRAVTARIEAESISVAGRTVRFFSSLLRFR